MEFASSKILLISTFLYRWHSTDTLAQQANNDNEELDFELDYDALFAVIKKVYGSNMDKFVQEFKEWNLKESKQKSDSSDKAKQEKSNEAESSKPQKYGLIEDFWVI